MNTASMNAIVHQRNARLDLIHAPNFFGSQSGGKSSCMNALPRRSSRYTAAISANNPAAP